MYTTTAEQRQYSVCTVEQAKSIALNFLTEIDLNKVLKLGLPEIDDRYHIWRISVIDKNNSRIGEVVINARTSLVDGKKSTSKELFEKSLLGRNGELKSKKISRMNKFNEYPLSHLRNTVVLGNSEEILQELPAASIDLIFTSPPYYNAR